MDERRKQEHEQLHGGHALVEQLCPRALVVLQQGAAVLRPRAGARAGGPRGGALVPQRLEEGAAAAAPGPALVAQRLLVALLRGVQQHPVQRVQQLGLRHSQLVLVA